jgi:hypothetical protein
LAESLSQQQSTEEEKEDWREEEEKEGGELMVCAVTERWIAMAQWEKRKAGER